MTHGTAPFLLSTTMAIMGLLLYIVCLGITVIPGVKKRILDALHRHHVNRLRATLDREERRHQQADGRDEESA